MECDTLLAQTMSNGHVPVYHYSNRYVQDCSHILNFSQSVRLCACMYTCVCIEAFSPKHVPPLSEPEHHGDGEDHCFLPEDSTLQLLNTSEQPISSQDLMGNARFYNGDIIKENAINQGTSPFSQNFKMMQLMHLPHA